MAKFVFEPLKPEGLRLVTPAIMRDSRGFFVETYHASAFREGGIEAVFVQDNQSFSSRAGTVRGLHFQRPPHAQAKLVRVVRGAIFDVAVDIRVGSPSFGKWSAATLSAATGQQLFIPRGFAHGFCTLEPDTEVAYKVDAHYEPAHDAGLFWNDPEIGIAWPVSEADAVLAERDTKLPRMKDFSSPFRLADA